MGKEPTDKGVVAGTFDPVKSGDQPGRIAATIGTGKHAKTAIAWSTIKWTFIAGVIISLCIFLSACLTRSEFTFQSIEKLWGVLLPIVTLVLGYIFGKSGDGE